MAASSVNDARKDQPFSARVVIVARRLAGVCPLNAGSKIRLGYFETNIPLVSCEERTMQEGKMLPSRQISRIIL
jgi:hypothetical protein